MTGEAKRSMVAGAALGTFTALTVLFGLWFYTTQRTTHATQAVTAQTVDSVAGQGGSTWLWVLLAFGLGGKFLIAIGRNKQRRADTWGFWKSRKR